MHRRHLVSLRPHAPRDHDESYRSCRQPDAGQGDPGCQPSLGTTRDAGCRWRSGSAGATDCCIRCRYPPRLRCPSTSRQSPPETYDAAVLIFCKLRAAVQPESGLQFHPKNLSRKFKEKMSFGIEI